MYTDWSGWFKTYRLGVLFLLEVDVAHVDAQPSGVRVLLVAHDQRVAVDRLLVHAIAFVARSQCEADGVRELEVDLVEKENCVSSIILPTRQSLQKNQ